MARAFVPSKPRKESLLMFAGEKVGKTTALLEIATRIDGRVFMMDSDDTFDASVGDFPELEQHLDRFTIYRPDDWEDYRRYGNEAVIKAQEGDWISVDRVDPGRQHVTDHFIEQIYGQNAASWVVETLRDKRDEGKKGSINTEIPWSNINSAWYSWVNYLHRKSKAHIFWACNAKKLIKEGMFADDSRLIDLYSEVGHKPGGGNDLGYIPHTILYMNKGPDGTRYLTTIGDRGRKNSFLNAEEMGSFFNTYMIPVAGWRPKKSG